MNHHQRIEAALKAQWPDCRPVMLHNFLSAAYEAGLSMRQFRENPVAIAKSFIQAVETYEYDGLVVDVDTSTLAGAVGVPVDFPEDLPARCTAPALERLEDVWKLEPADILSYDQVQIWLEATRLLCRHFGNEMWVRGNCDQAPFSLACLMRGVEKWLVDLTEEDAWPAVERLLDFCTDAVSQFVRAMAATGVHMVSNGDSFAGLVSRRTYQTFAQPTEQKIARLAHDLNLPYALHVCGRTNHILADLAELDADALELDQCTNATLAHEAFGNDKVFIGNLDPSRVLCYGSRDLVQEKTRELLSIFEDTPRLILNAGCAIPAGTPGENLHAMIQTARECPIQVS